ncbi:MAG: bifunctional diaminohydroxyphosphoribosylaminopyrimidine deaminase/5-amino-6-(5-phosphoribosylamino)uracil reductase RibD [Colwellia sp.]
MSEISKNFSQLDHHYMARAISLAKKGHFTTSPNPRVGCVLVSYAEGEGKIIGEGFHQKVGCAHAEVNALLMANKENSALIKGATAYVTLEPCSHFGRTPPCAQALIDAGIKRVIAAMVDPDERVSGRGLALLEQAGINTQSGLLENEARTLNVGFIKNRTTNLPYVRCKLAASIDGKTAMENGESQWITSSKARQDVQRLRAQSCAIITGADSVIIDNAKMTVRWSELGDLKKQYQQADLRQPIRVIIDSRNRLTPEMAIFNYSSPIIIINALLAKEVNKTKTLENLSQWPHFVEQVPLPVVKSANNECKIDLMAVLQFLAKRGVNDVLLESGANLAGAFIEQNLVDELILYQAPKLMGGDGKNLLEMPSIKTLSSAKKLMINDVRLVGCDIKITAKLVLNG